MAIDVAKQFIRTLMSAGPWLGCLLLSGCQTVPSMSTASKAPAAPTVPTVQTELRPSPVTFASQEAQPAQEWLAQNTPVTSNRQPWPTLPPAPVFNTTYEPMVVRGQSPSGYAPTTPQQDAGNTDYFRTPMQPSGGPVTPNNNGYNRVAQNPLPAPSYSNQTYPDGGAVSVPYSGQPLEISPYSPQMIDPNLGMGTNVIPSYQPRERIAPLDVYVQEARTGRIMLGGSVNSDLGVAGQFIVEERNFDLFRPPTSWEDVWSGKAWRGAGQNFRLELMPGNRVERYTVNWTERNLFGYLPVSLSVGGFLFTRRYRDWDEQRLGGRVALGYELTPDLSISGELRAENVDVYNPRVLGVPELDRVLGGSDMFTARARLAHDTRDNPFMATEGHLLELIYDQVFGSYDYPRAMINHSKYFLVSERADQSGRHVLAHSLRLGFSGGDTPVFENFFAGGYSTMRGFSFRGASPRTNDVIVGGQFQFLGSLEYIFPLTADDMLRGIAFVDYGTIERDIEINSENFRVAPGLGLRVTVPALGPAPLAFDFAFPVAYADNDDRQVFSFFLGFTR